MVKVTDFIKMLPNNKDADESETEKLIKDLDVVDLADIANAIGIEVHLIKNQRGRPKRNTEQKIQKEKKAVGRPKKEKIVEEKVLKKRGRKPKPKPVKSDEEKVLKKRGRKPKNKNITVLTDEERLKRKEKFIKQITYIANIIDNFDQDLISKII